MQNLKKFKINLHNLKKNVILLLCEIDIYMKLFVKMAKMGFPQEFEGVKMKYEYNNYVCDICYNGSTEEKILKMWGLMNE